MARFDSSQYAVVIPVYNEERFIKQFLQELIEYCIQSQFSPLIIIVNDGSTDSTEKIIETFSFPKKISHKFISLDENNGKGAALRIGLEYAKNAEKRGVIFMDGDRQHQPKFIDQFVAQLKKVPLVFGYRKFDKRMSFLRRCGNQFSAFVFKHLFLIQRRDPMCGFMAIRSDVYEQMQWESNNYGVEAEISAKAGKQQIPFKEVEIPTIYLDKKTGFNIKDAVNILWQLPLLFFYTRLTARDRKVVFIGALLTFIYCLLAFKYIFRETSLIGNLEPYPDSLYYATPAWNLSRGFAFGMQTPEYATKLETPILYSIYLLPFFTLIHDIRIFYLANLLLGIGSVWLFFGSLKHVLQYKNYSVLLFGLVGFFFVTHFYIFTLPTLLMAENLSVFLTLLGIYILTKRASWHLLSLGAFLPVLLMLTKFSNFPVAVCIGTALYIKIFFSNKSFSRRLQLCTFGLLNIFIFLLYLKMSQILVGHKNLQGSDTFSMTHMKENALFYIQTLLGEPTRFLWWTERFFPNGLARLAMLGSVLGVFTQQRKWWVIGGIVYIFAVTIFMSSFAATDARYMLVVLPIMLLFCAVGLQVIARVSPRLQMVLLFVLFCGYLVWPYFSFRFPVPNAVVYKQQVGLNFKHTETPWNYLAVKEFDRYLEKHDGKKTHLITVLPSPYFYLVGSRNYTVLPLTVTQEFVSADTALQQKFSNGNVIRYYRQLIAQGHQLYITNYYINNLKIWQSEFDQLSQVFDLEKVHTGCLEACNIYTLQEKSE